MTAQDSATIQELVQAAKKRAEDAGAAMHMADFKAVYENLFEILVITATLNQIVDQAEARA